MKSVVLLLTLSVLSVPAIADKSVKEEVKGPKIEVKKENPHKNLHLYFLDRRPYISPKHDNHNKISS